MKQCFFLILFLFISILIHAQEVAVSKEGKSVPIQLNPNSSVITHLKSGEVKGSPMLSDHWSIGSVQFKNGKSIDSIQLQFNLETNILLFRQQGLVLEFVDTVVEAMFNYQEQGGSTHVTLRSNYPAIEKHTASTFYIVIAGGSKFQLLQYKSKGRVEQYNYGLPAS